MPNIIQALHVARTGLNVAETRLGVTANNLSNASSTAFKKQFMTATDLGYQDLVVSTSSDASGLSPTTFQLGLGVKVAGVGRVFSRGDLISTSHSLSVAIDGDGFFKIQRPDGTTAYTRNGVFERSPTGQLQLQSNGYPVVPAITIPPDTVGILIQDDGTVMAKVGQDQVQQQAGQIDTATFFNPGGLIAVGDGLFVESSSSGAPTLGKPGSGGRGRLVQGHYEGSNVNSVEEVTDMIKNQRSYEMLTKVLHVGDAMLEAVNRSV